MRTTNKNEMKGSQKKQIKAVMNGSYANVIADESQNRMGNTFVGAIGGLVLGGIFRQNVLFTAVIGAIIGFITTKK